MRPQSMQPLIVKAGESESERERDSGGGGGGVVPPHHWKQQPRQQAIISRSPLDLAVEPHGYRRRFAVKARAEHRGGLHVPSPQGRSF